MTLNNVDERITGEGKASQEWQEEPTTDQQLLALAATYVPGSAEEKALVRKIDRRIIVCLLFYCGLTKADLAAASDMGSLYLVIPRPSQHW